MKSSFKMQITAFNRDFNPGWAARKWLEELAIFLNMPKLEGEDDWQHKNRMFAQAKKKGGRP